MTQAVAGKDLAREQVLADLDRLGIQPFLGSVEMSQAIYETLIEHITIAEGDHIWCVCGFRTQGGAESAGRESIVHVSNMLHATLVHWVRQYQLFTHANRAISTAGSKD